MNDPIVAGDIDDDGYKPRFVRVRASFMLILFMLIFIYFLTLSQIELPKIIIFLDLLFYFRQFFINLPSYFYNSVLLYKSDLRSIYQIIKLSDLHVILSIPHVIMSHFPIHIYI
jgi:uncharacterized membrane protein YesL